MSMLPMPPWYDPNGPWGGRTGGEAPEKNPGHADRRPGEWAAPSPITRGPMPGGDFNDWVERERRAAERRPQPLWPPGGDTMLRPQVQDPWGRSPMDPQYGQAPPGWTPPEHGGLWNGRGPYPQQPSAPRPMPKPAPPDWAPAYGYRARAGHPGMTGGMLGGILGAAPTIAGGMRQAVGQVAGASGRGGPQLADLFQSARSSSYGM
jgi:hypothetical protein